jgi:hypothetical protein
MEVTMLTRRLIPLCLVGLLAFSIRADEDLPPDAKKLIEENEKESDAILKKAEDYLKKAQEEKAKAEDEVAKRREKMIATLEELAKRLDKEGKTNQAKIIAEEVEVLKTGRIGGAMPDPGSPGQLRGQNGKSFVFEVTGRNGGGWGTDVYTDDTSIASAAVHAGLLQVGQKGAIKVTILPGQQAYTGSTRNGVTMGDWGPYGGSYKVELMKGRRVRADAVKPGAMPNPGTMTNFRGQIGKSFLFEVTGAQGGTVWGSGIYTDDSSIATAAVHAGVLKVGQKAVIKVTVAPGQQQYNGSMQNGITTHDYEAWGGSYTVEAVKK